METELGITYQRNTAGSFFFNRWPQCVWTLDSSWIQSFSLKKEQQKEQQHILNPLLNSKTSSITDGT